MGRTCGEANGPRRLPALSFWLAVGCCLLTLAGEDAGDVVRVHTVDAHRHNRGTLGNGLWPKP